MFKLALKPIHKKPFRWHIFVVLALVGVMTGGTTMAFQDANVLQSPIVQNGDPVVPQASNVFGSRLFGGEFAKQSFAGFNPDYQLAVGDVITVTLWGGFEHSAELTVDAQGNVFLPNVGPVKILGVRNADLNQVISDAIKSVYKHNVGVYASLNGAEPVKVFVTGYAKHPGLYAGHASDSILYFLDKAGGIDDNRGSFLSVRVLRAGRVLHAVNLYDFILSGQIPVFQLKDGDTIVVDAVRSRVSVVGEVHNAYHYEFDGPTTVADLMRLAHPKPAATHLRIERSGREQSEVEYRELANAGDVVLESGDRVSVVTDKLPGTISVRVEGEHESLKEFIMPYGATLQDLIAKVHFGQNAERQSIQLLRESVKVRQKELLEAQLRALEKSILTARSKTASEAQLRKVEAELVLEWLKRAETVEPRGQVTLAGLKSYKDILLEPGDVIRVPRRSNLVSIHGDVLFPNAVAYNSGHSVDDYLDRAGGMSQAKGAVNVLVLHRDGTFLKLGRKQLDDRDLDIRPGDEIFVLPKVETKSFQLAKDIIEVFYQLALSAGVVLSL